MSSQKDEEERDSRSEEGDGEVKSDRGSFKVDDDSSSQSSSPLKGEVGQGDDGQDRQNLTKRQVHFSPASESTTAAA